MSGEQVVAKMAAEDPPDPLYWVVCHNCVAAFNDTPKETQ